MQGYGAIAAEIVEQSESRTDKPAFTHVFLQGGVGGATKLAARAFVEHLKSKLY